MKTQEEFDQYINSKIDNKDVEQYDKLSKSIKPLGIIGAILFAAAFAGILIGMITMQRGSFDSPNKIMSLSVVLFDVAFGLFVATGVLATKRSKLVKKYKTDMIEFALCDRPHTYERGSCITKKIFVKSQFVSYGKINEYRGEDLLQLPLIGQDGKETQVKLNICDITAIEHYTDHEGNPKEQTLYSGMFGYINFPHPFKTTLSINSSFSGKFSLEKVTLEDIDFNKKFKVRASDQIEARYILSVDMMLYLKDLASKLGYTKIVLTENTMYIGFPNHNLFDSRLKCKTGLTSNFYSCYEDICTLVNFCETIQNNDKIFDLSTTSQDDESIAE